MKCPLCKTEKLTTRAYEGVSIRTCVGCRGSLVRRARLNAIRNSREKSEIDFLDELSVPTAESDTAASVHCPECSRAMDKERKSVGKEKFFVDACRRCNLVWFDAGELAKFQLNYESSAQGVEMTAIRKRLETMSDQERKELDARIAALGGPRIFDKSDYWLATYVLLRAFRC